MEIFLYEDGIGKELDVAEISRYLTRKMRGVRIEIRGNLFPATLTPDEVGDYARSLAGIKITQAHQKAKLPQEPLYGEVEYEKRRILGKTKSFGVLYDGFRLLRILGELVPREERKMECLHIIFSNRLLATWDDSDRRYHLRTSLYGLPSIISTTGLVEAPAKPREYYRLKQQYEMIGRDVIGLKDRFQGRFIDYEDRRLTDVAKGYVMQAVGYALTGDPFCPDKGCRLYNAHWQEELIFAQLESEYEFCPHHARLFEER